MAIKVTLYKWANCGSDLRPLELWKRLSGLVCENPISSFGTLPSLYRGFVIKASSQSRSGYIHSATVKVNFLRMVGDSYLELSCKSHFCREVDGVSVKVSDLPTSLQKWARSVSSTSIQEHVTRVNEFVSYCCSVGIELSNTVLDALQVNATIRTGSGSYKSPSFDSKLGLLDPYRRPRSCSIVVHSGNSQVAESCISQLRLAQSRLLGQEPFVERWLSTGLEAKGFTSGDLHLVIVPDSVDFTLDLKWQRLFYTLERNGLKFKVVNQSRASDRFVCGNLIFDLFQKAGGVPWTVDFSDPRLICAVDAGHHKELGLSRWTACRFSKEKLRQRIYLEDVQLAEQIPPGVCTKLFAKLSGTNSLILRDGRSHKSDRDYFAEANLDVVEVNKRPNSVLYEQSEGGISAAQPGTYIRYPDGSILLQSAMNPYTKDYTRPIRLTSLHALTDEIISDLQGLALLPSTTMSHSIRLPLPLYWADLASKLNNGDWAKVLGNGWSLQELVPELRNAMH